MTQHANERMLTFRCHPELEEATHPRRPREVQPPAVPNFLRSEGGEIR